MTPRDHSKQQRADQDRDEEQGNMIKGKALIGGRSASMIKA
ncbi:hypothetical protein ACS18Q_14860 [Vibrio sp. Vf1514]|nr:hypothetical protein [Vibrio sp. Vb2880]